MYNKYQQIDDFLKMWRDVAMENPNFSFLEHRKTVYHYLTRLGVSDYDQNLTINESIFPNWTKRFAKTENISCFVSKTWQYFCQFVNHCNPSNDNIKVYIPLDSAHIYEGANMIFDFLAKNNIRHDSKIGKHIRFDDIVVRLDTVESAEELLNFINGNSYIKEGLIAPNPFAYSKDGIALACDGMLSYNETVANIISLYIENAKKTNTLDKIGIQNFYNFLNDYYQDIFFNNNYNRLIADFNIEDFDEMSDYAITNYKQVLALIIKSVDSNFTYADYINHFKACETGSRNIDYLSKSPFTKQAEETADKEVETLLLEVINIMTIKYDRESAIRNVKNYINTDRSNFITRDHNLRQRAVNMSLANKVNGIIRNNDLSIEEYISLLEQKSKIQEQSNGTVYNKEQILINALQNTYNKYEAIENNGRSYMISALAQLVFYNSYSGFTRDNGTRDSVMNNISIIDVKQILMTKYGYNKIDNDTLLEAVNMYVDDILSMQKMY